MVSDKDKGKTAPADETKDSGGQSRQTVSTDGAPAQSKKNDAEDEKTEPAANKDKTAPVDETKDGGGQGRQKVSTDGAPAKSKKNDAEDEKPEPAANQPALENAQSKGQPESSIPSMPTLSYEKLERTASAAIATSKEAMATLEKSAGEISEKVKDVASQYESATVPGTPATERQMRLGHIAYLLFALGPLTGVSLLFGLFLCQLQLKSESINGTILHTHFRWLTHTFLFSVIAAVAATILAWLFGSLAGLVGSLALLIWYAYRIVKGWLSLYDSKDIANPRALW